eukprot:173951-Lingulodinium_polyedra.AAC.1
MQCQQAADQLVEGVRTSQPWMRSDAELRKWNGWWQKLGLQELPDMKEAGLEEPMPAISASLVHRAAGTYPAGTG